MGRICLGRLCKVTESIEGVDDVIGQKVQTMSPSSTTTTVFELEDVSLVRRESNHQKPPPSSDLCLTTEKTSADDSDTDHSSRGDATMPAGCLRIRSQEESLSIEYAKNHAPESSEKRVGFAKVTISSHCIVLGDNPSVSEGPPISISWRAFDTETFDLDEYEEYKPFPRAQSQLHIPKQLRIEWLRHIGYTRNQLATVSREVQRIQKRRTISVNNHLLLMNGESSNPYNPTGRSALLIKQAAKSVIVAARKRRQRSKKPSIESLNKVDL